MKINAWFLAILFLMASIVIPMTSMAQSTTSTVGINFVGDGSIEVDVTLQKLDKDTKALLKGATFELRDNDGKTVNVKESLTTNSKGEIKLKRLHPGKYVFVETKSPSGYQLDATPIAFEVDFAKPQAKVIAYNKKIADKLPQTGNKNTMNLVVLGLFMVMATGYGLCCQKNRNIF